ncbi:MAG TPA: hypothetical protein VFW44_19605 [Bryobacteraceae bacterium]|nr:hypothetical protein [Bryobacteraceae bacterium]
MKNLIITAIAGAALCFAPMAGLLSAQAVAGVTATPPASTVPHTADGHPDLSGVWWRGADVGGRPAGGRQQAPPRPTTPPVFFSSLYTPEAQAHAKTLGDKDDPTLHCTGTAFGTLNVSLFDVGAVGQIVQTPKFLIMLSETFNGFQIIPFDGRPHRDNVPPSNRGDAVGHWDGDTLVVDKNNFTDNTWISAEGRVSYHSDALHIVERYRRLDANTLQIDATLEDPKVLSKPWVVPTQTLQLAPFDQIMELPCSPSDTQSQRDAAPPATVGKK